MRHLNHGSTGLAGPRSGMASMLPSRNAACRSPAQRVHLRDANGVAPPPQLASEVARMKAEVKDQWKRGTQIVGQMKAKLQGNLEQLRTSSSNGARRSASTGHLLANSRMDTVQAPEQDPKISCLCDVGIPRVVAELALQQTQGSGINDALDWVYNPANSEIIERAATGSAAITHGASARSPGQASDAQVNDSPAVTLSAPSASPEDYLSRPSVSPQKALSTPLTQEKDTAVHKSIPSRKHRLSDLRRVSNDGRGLGMGIGRGSGRSSKGCSSDCSPAPRTVSSLQLPVGDSQVEESEVHQVLYSARGSAYRVRKDSLERCEAPQDISSASPDTSSSACSQEDDDTADSTSEEEAEENEDHEEDKEVDEDDKSKDMGLEESTDDSAWVSRVTHEDESDVMESPPIAPPDQEFLQVHAPDGTSWDWPLSRTEKKTRLQMIERGMHLIDRRTIMQELIDTRVKLRHQSSECGSGDSSQ